MFGKHKGQHRLGASQEAVPEDAARRRLLKGALGAAGLGIAGAVAPGAAHAGGQGGGGWPCPPDEPNPGPGKPEPDEPGPGKPGPQDPKPEPGEPGPGKPGPQEPQPCPPYEHGRCVEWCKVDSWCDGGYLIVHWVSRCTSCGRKCEDYYECAGCC